MESVKASIGDHLLLKLKGGLEIRGTLMPRYGYADDRHITIKLGNGYNIGILVSRIEGVTVEKRGTFEPSKPSEASFKSGGEVLILGTGGTIASRIDYRTGAVTSVLTPSELYSSVPELGDIAKLDTEVLFNILSENMTPSRWDEMAKRVGRAVKDGYRGIVIAHGTDTMHYTSAALSFALENLPVPVVLVGAQRSSDRPSSDAATNLLGAVTVAAMADFSGVYIAMHKGLSDDVIAVHSGVKVRKNHTSRRDAFQSVNSRPAALVHLKGLRIIKNLELPPRRDGHQDFSVKSNFDERAFLVKYFPGMSGEIIDHLVEIGYRAIILEGTGLGHVGKPLHESIGSAIDKGVFIGMTSQCLWGRVRMTVYDTGRDLLRMGVIPLEDILPEVAVVKAMWLLGQGATFEDMVKLMPMNMRGEVSGRSLISYEHGRT